MSIEVGSIVEGKVTGIAKFGAFVDLGGGQNGLVHISEISDKYVEDIHKEVDKGQTVKVKVLSIADDGKIALSIRKAQANAGQDQAKAKEEQKEEVGTKANPYKKRNNKKDFDAMMNYFLKDSEDSLSSLRKNTEGKRGGRGSRRS